RGVARMLIRMMYSTSMKRLNLGVWLTWLSRRGRLTLVTGPRCPLSLPRVGAAYTRLFWTSVLLRAGGGHRGRREHPDRGLQLAEAAYGHSYLEECLESG